MRFQHSRGQSTRHLIDVATMCPTKCVLPERRTCQVRRTGRGRGNREVGPSTNVFFIVARLDASTTHHTTGDDPSYCLRDGVSSRRAAGDRLWRSWRPFAPVPGASSTTTATLPGSLVHRGTCGHSNALVLRYYGALTATIHICKIMGTTTRRLRTHGSQSFRAAAILPYYGNGVSPPAGRPADLPLHTQPLATTGGAQLPIRRIIAKTSHPSGALSVRDAAGPVE